MYSKKEIEAQWRNEWGGKILFSQVIALSAVMKTKLCTILCFTALIQESFGKPFNYTVFSPGNKSTNKSQFTRCSSWSHLLKMPPAKLFDNHRQIVPVGLQKEWSSSQHN